MAAVRRLVPSLLLALAGAAFAVLLVELGVRATGLDRSPQRDPVAGHWALHEIDPILGWRNRPGDHVSPRLGGEPGRIHFTFLPDGSRSTGRGPAHSTAEVLVVGCSFTLGWGLDDAETYAWRLQQELPEVSVRNFGTAGYGTYQSLLRVERALETRSEVPRLVLYGFADFHEARNVAAHAWLKALASTSGDAIRVPYCSFDRDGALRRQSAIGYRTWPFHDVLASVRLLEDRVETVAAPVREGQARAVTQALVGEMDRVARAAGARLIVAQLAVARQETKRAYAEYGREHDIDLVDCTNEDFQQARMRLRGDLHPNAAMHGFWANCLETALRRRLADPTRLR